MNVPVSVEIGKLVLLVGHTKIVHHISGRIRLRVLPSGIAVARKIDLDQLKEHLQGIKGVRVNAIVGSVVIEYDPVLISPSLWEDLAGSNANPERVSILEATLAALWKE